MLSRVSSLSNVVSFERDDIAILEASDFTLTQVAGEPKALKTAFPKLPETIDKVVDYEGKSVLRIGPNQLWVLGTPPLPQTDLFLTPLSSSRTRIKLDGPLTRDVLSKCAAIDFHPKAFPPGKFVMTGIHHMPVLIHCIEDKIFHIYILRTFALTLWEWFVDAAEE